MGNRLERIRKNQINFLFFYRNSSSKKRNKKQKKKCDKEMIQ